MAQDELISTHTAEIERLRLLITRLQRMQFGRKSEKLQRHIEQSQLQLDDLQTSDAERKLEAESELPTAAATIFAKVTRNPARRALPDHLPRETQTHSGCVNSCVSFGAREFS